MVGEVEISSKRKDGRKSTPSFFVIECDRTNPILGNRFVLSNHEDDEERTKVIDLYREEYLRDISQQGPMFRETRSLAKRVRDGENISLKCWCAPKPCHAEIIRDKIFELIPTIEKTKNMSSVSKEEIAEIVRRIFPLPNFNPGQLEAIVETVSAVLEGKKHIILDAPTGSGKSLIATVSHRTLQQIKGKWRTTLITSSKSLQDQYTNDDRSIVDLRGKTNYSCVYNVGPYNSGGCRAKIANKTCVKAEVCPYVRKRTQWCKIADLRITNSSFQIEANPQICMLPENQANLIVIDECHEIEDHIISHTSIELNVEDYILLKQYPGGQELVSTLANYIEIFKNIQVGSTFTISNSMYEGMEVINELVSNIVENFEELLTQPRNDKELIGDLMESLQQIQDTTSIFDACDQREGTWILHDYGTGKCEIKPVFAWQVAEHALFRKADFFLHMSATVCGFEQYMKDLGIPEDEVHLIEVPNSIPLKNRIVKVIPTQKVSGNFDINKLARDIDTIIKMNPGKNGIIHTVSFKLANEIMERSKFSKNMLVSGDRRDILDFLGQKNSGKIVLSPSIEKGFDAKGDLSRFQILAKCPFGFLGDPLISLNAKDRPSWYGRKTVLRLVQSCGRSIRGVDDWANTYILDANFLRLLRENYDVFPEWFVESLEIVE